LNRVVIFILSLIIFSSISGCKSDEGLSKFKSNKKSAGAKSSTDWGFNISYLRPKSYPSYDASITFELHNYITGNGSELIIYKDTGCKKEILRKEMPINTYATLYLTLKTIGDHVIGARSYDGYKKKYSDCISLPVTILRPLKPTMVTISDPEVLPTFDTTPTVNVSDLELDHYAMIFIDPVCKYPIGVSKASPSNSINVESLFHLNPGTHKIYATAINEGGVHSECSTTYATYQVKNPLTPTGVSLADNGTPPFYDNTPKIKVSGVVSGTMVKIYKDSSCNVEVGSGIAKGTEVEIMSSSVEPGQTYQFHAKAFIGDVGSTCSTASLSYNLSYTNSLIGFSIIAPATTSEIYNRPRIKADFTMNKRRSISVYTDASCTQHFHDSYSYISNSIKFDLPRLAPGSYTFYIKSYEDGGITNCSTGNVNYQVLTNSRLPLSFGTSLDMTSLRNIQFSDLDRDGQKDIVAISGKNIIWYKNKGNKLFDSYKILSEVYSDVAEESYSIADINGDLYPDIIAGVTEDFNGIKVLLNNGSGGFGPIMKISAGKFTKSEDIKTGDVNNDGKLDIIQLVSGAVNDVIIYKGLGNGNFGLINTASLVPQKDAEKMDVSDVNQDGFIDIVVSQFQAKNISIFINNGLGQFSHVENLSMTESVTDLKTKDINNDGKVDIIASSLTLGVSTFISVGAGNFRDEVIYNVPASLISEFSLSDVDKDNELDVIIGDYADEENRFFILFGKGDGSFSSAIDYPTTQKSTSIKAMDLNNDSKIDFVFGRSGLNFIFQ